MPQLKFTEVDKVYSSFTDLRTIETRRMRWTGHVARMRKTRDILLEKITDKNNIIMYIKQENTEKSGTKCDQRFSRW
jgi:hypothetical protein